MKDKVRNYVDDLFKDIDENRQLRELKEEITVNLLAGINDNLANGKSRDEAFHDAKLHLGDISELISSLKKASEARTQDSGSHPWSDPPDRKQALGFVAASAVIMIGLVLAGIAYVRWGELLTAGAVAVPFAAVSGAIFAYYALIHETRHEYGMTGKRALAYSISGAVSFLGLSVAAYLYLTDHGIAASLFSLSPFIIPAALCIIYLALTEKSRAKSDSEWRQYWVDYYRNPSAMMLRGNISGALWIFAIAAFIILGFTWGWKYSWTVFIVAIGLEITVEAVFSAKSRK